MRISNLTIVQSCVDRLQAILETDETLTVMQTIELTISIKNLELILGKNTNEENSG